MTAKCTIKYGSQRTHWNKLVKNACSASWGIELGFYLGINLMKFPPCQFGSLWKLGEESLKCCKYWIFINKSLLIIIILVPSPLCIFFGPQPVDYKFANNTHGKPQEWNTILGSFTSVAEISEIFLTTVQSLKCQSYHLLHFMS